MRRIIGAARRNIGAHSRQHELPHHDGSFL
jgi:hypothetical protein